MGNAGPYFTKKDAESAKKVFEKRWGIKVKIKHYKSKRYDLQAPCYRIYW